MKKLFLLLMAVISIGLCASAQTRTARGTVLDANTDEPLIGASVKAAQGYGAVTDVDGQFVLKFPAGIDKLEVSYIGYKAVNVAVTDGNMEIRLEPISQVMDEVIVTGYGKQTRASYTGSATVLKSETLEQTQVTNALDAIQGRVAGVQITNASGAPGQTSPNIVIRGITSINAGTDPLIIVDGAPYAGDLNSISTHDIASMTVLKDAASNALYGARGANGVIVITTKAGGNHGKARVTVDAKWGANSKAIQNYNVITDPRQYYETYYSAINRYAVTDRGMSADQAYMWANEQFINNEAFGLGYNTFTVPAGQTLIGRDGKFNPKATPGRLVNYEGQDYWLQPDNWMDATFKTSLRQEYNFSVSNGNDKGEFYASFNYLNNEGITPNSNYERFTGRISANTQATSWLKVGAQAAYAHYSQKSLDEEGSSSSTGNIFAAATQIAPIYPVFVRDGKGNIRYDEYGNAMYDYGKGMNAGLNRPIYGDSNAISKAILDTNELEGNNFYGFAFAEISFLRDFKFTTNNTVNLDEYRGTGVTNPYYGQYAVMNGIVSKSHTRTISYTFQQMLQWSHLFGKHNVNVLAVHENTWDKGYVLSASKNSMFSPDNHELAGAIIDGSPNSYTSDYNNEGWVFRGMYDFDNKYFANLSFRRDGSSRFHPDHRWGNFWSLGAAWMISKEKFFNCDAFDILKFKASYGEQGNDRIGNYRYTTTYAIVNNNGTPAAVPSSMGNPNISWEKGGNFNVGFDFSLWKGRLSGTLEGFYRKTTDMLSLFYLPSSFGFTSYYDNVGDMTNGGIELDLAGTVIQTRDFSWSLNLNFTWYKNEITRVAEKNRTTVVDGHGGYTSGSYFYGEGLPLYTFYIPEYAGVDRETGEPMWYKNVLDENKKPTGKRVTTKEYGEAGNYLMGSALPPCYGGFGTSFIYRDFDLSLDFAYQIGGQVLDSDYAGLMSAPSPAAKGGGAIHADILNSWTSENKNSNLPVYKYGMNDNSKTSSLWLTDASYLMLKNINFGYTLPRNLTRKLTIDKVRVYFTAENVWLWSQRQGLNPSQSISGGANNTYYAPMRTLSGGINVTF